MRRLSISRSPPELLAHYKSSGMRLLVRFCRMALQCSAHSDVCLLSTFPHYAASDRHKDVCADDCVSLTSTVCVLVNSCREHWSTVAKWKCTQSGKAVLFWTTAGKYLRERWFQALVYVCCWLVWFYITNILQHIVSGWNAMISFSLYTLRSSVLDNGLCVIVLKWL